MSCFFWDGSHVAGSEMLIFCLGPIYAGSECFTRQREKGEGRRRDGD